MPEPDAPSVRERHLARHLRVQRVSAGLQGKEVADRLGWSASKVSRIENGRIGISTEDLERLIELYGVADSPAGALRRLAASVRARGWWDAYRDQLTPSYGSLLTLEAGSSALQSYAALVPHALLMTTEFARRVIMLAPQPPPAPEVERRIDVVRRRQEVLRPRGDRPALDLSVVLDESFLHRRMARTGDDRDHGDDAAMMARQLRHLLEAMAEPNVSLRLLPFDVGLPPVTAGSFSVLSSDALAAPDVVYLENKSRIFFVESEREVAGYVQDFELLQRWSLSEDKTAERLRRKLTDLDGGR